MILNLLYAVIPVVIVAAIATFLFFFSEERLRNGGFLQFVTSGVAVLFMIIWLLGAFHPLDVWNQYCKARDIGMFIGVCGCLILLAVPSIVGFMLGVIPLALTEKRTQHETGNLQTS